MAKSSSKGLSWGEFLWTTVRAIARVTFWVSFVGSVILVLVLDVLLGAVALDTVLVHSILITTPLGSFHLSAPLISTSVSLAATAIRFAMWEMQFKEKRASLMVWIAAAIMVVFNTLIDLSAIAHVFFHAAPGAIFPTQMNGGYMFMAVLVSVICTMDCLLTTKLLEIMERLCD